MIAGRYSLDREIGRGGMGAVWSGTDHTLGRTVALKRIGVAPGGADVDVRRAEREARLAARLNHPHVVAVFDLCEDDDAQWMVMEHVEGTNLSQIIRDAGPLAPDQVAPLLGQVADALAAAHSAGIVHRDVKPSNILVTPEGLVKLTDFGIARTEADAALTQTGLVTGSPAYLAPEVAMGSSATEASDVWSLGATLCHALTGKPPYEVGDGQSGVMGALYRIVNDEPPRPASAGWLAPLLAATMDKDPARRWSAEQVRAFLEAGPSQVTAVMEAVTAPVMPVAPVESVEPVALTTPVRPSAAPAPRRRSRWPVAVAVLAVLLLIGVAITAGLLDDDPPSGTAGPGPTDPSSTTVPPDGRPSAATMEQFIADYLDLVVSDPEAAFEQLTPAFQKASDGLEGYLGFWGDVTSTELVEASADPKSLVVDYTYRYHVRGEGQPRTDDVSLQLAVGGDGGLLIAGEA